MTFFNGTSLKSIDKSVNLCYHTYRLKVTQPREQKHTKTLEVAASRVFLSFTADRTVGLVLSFAFVQPLAYVVGRYTCQYGDDKGDKYLHVSTSFPLERVDSSNILSQYSGFFNGFWQKKKKLPRGSAPMRSLAGAFFYLLPKKSTKIIPFSSSV